MVKVAVSRIPDEGRSLRFSLDENWWSEMAADGHPVDFVLHRVDVVCDLRKAGETVYVRGEIDALLTLPCSRCLEHAEMPVHTEFRYTFVPGHPPSDAEKELGAEELEEGFYEEDTIDLAPVIFEQILLQVPIKVLCREDCQGLCPQCGANRNVAPCDCRSETGDPRLAVLKNFRVKS